MRVEQQAGHFALGVSSAFAPIKLSLNFLIEPGIIKIAAPSFPPMVKSGNPSFPTRVLQRLKPNQWFRPVGDDHFFAIERFADELRKMSLGFVNGGLSHGTNLAN